MSECPNVQIDVQIAPKPLITQNIIWTLRTLLLCPKERGMSKCPNRTPLFGHLEFGHNPQQTPGEPPHAGGPAW